MGVIGLGGIGTGIADRLAALNCRLAVWSRSLAKRVAAQHRWGDVVRASPADVARDASILIVAVTDDDAVRAVFYGPRGIQKGLTASSLLLNTSTTSPGLARELADACESVRAGFMDAPMIGGEAALAAGGTTFLCGGSVDAFGRAESVLGAIGRAEHVGPVGSGQLLKVVNQVMLAGYYVGVAEGLALAASAGLDLSRVIEVLGRGSAASWVLSTRGATMAGLAADSHGRTDLHLKDLRIALELASDLGLTLPNATLTAGLEADSVEGATRPDTSFRTFAKGFLPNPRAARRQK